MPRNEMYDDDQDEQDDDLFSKDLEGTVIDFEGVSSKGFVPIPAGTYLAELSRVTREIGKESKQPYLKWEFTITEGEHAGRKQWTQTSLQEKSRWSVKHVLEALEGEEITGEYTFQPSRLIGNTVMLRVKIRSYQGEPQNTVKDVLPVREGEEYEAERAAEIEAESAAADEEENVEDAAEEADAPQAAPPPAPVKAPVVPARAPAGKRPSLFN